MSPSPLRTPRLLLRQWESADRAPFAALNADPRVMEHFPAVLTRSESDAAADRYAAGIAERGWGIWAVELAGAGDFVGFVGLNPVGPEYPFGPATEIGWRLACEHWGYGYATEAASAALDHAFMNVALEEVVSFTAVTNVRSQHVMIRLHMTHDAAEDFDHPTLPVGHRLLRHVLYRARRTN